MGACTPGGLFFLFALLTDSNVHFDEFVWFLMAGAGGFGGWRLAGKVANGDKQ